MIENSHYSASPELDLIKQSPTFCIIVAVYNAAEFLQRCIDSVLSQTIPDYELIVIDGLSTDGTVEILKHNDSAITYWESSKDSGIYDAWNKALSHAHAEWCYFLGADDVLASSSILEQVKGCLTRIEPGTNIVYGQVLVVSPDDAPIEVVGKDWSYIKRKAFQVMSIPHQGVFQRRSLFRKHGPFDADFRVAGDFDFLLRELKGSDPVFLPDIIVARWRIGGVSSSGRMAEIAFAEFARARRKNGLTGIPLLLHWNQAKMQVRKFVHKVFGAKIDAVIADTYRQLTRRTKIWTKSSLARK